CRNLERLAQKMKFPAGAKVVLRRVAAFKKRLLIFSDLRIPGTEYRTLPDCSPFPARSALIHATSSRRPLVSNNYKAKTADHKNSIFRHYFRGYICGIGNH
ncbi:MAG: hypothetical protein KDD09_12670, partial [Phaeodactylibacter sp.]|nr:hypothetical protein [Phaeodactylibacter sp.]MCB0612670.1 hypothetical protein [Phaeodactylibacter sp.]